MKVKYTGHDLVRVNGKLIKPNETVELDDRVAKSVSSSSNFELVIDEKPKTKAASKKAEKRKGGE